MSKIALVDVDGVVAAFVPALLEDIESDVKPEEITGWRIKDFLPQIDHALCDEALGDPEFWSSIPPIPNARIGIDRLRLLGYEIVWVTSPFVSCEGWEYARRLWLRDHFNAEPEQIIVTSRKELVRGDLFIDDKLEHVVHWQALNPDGHGLLFNASYNQDPLMTIPRLNGWLDLPQHLQRIAWPSWPIGEV